MSKNLKIINHFHNIDNYISSVSKKSKSETDPIFMEQFKKIEKTAFQDFKNNTLKTD